MSKLAKRKRWRPLIEDQSVPRHLQLALDAHGYVIGGAGGFHLPQRAGRYSSIAPPPAKPKRRKRAA